ncbi:serine/threonine protein kinase [Microbispora sp. NBC_01189]|uniref:serine/threonine-protein kinase n=1 Tax=Microbispora sp. NBC_01189 TaxID=2903583 RepID=UPI002E12F3E8|nr:serine/threonine protein kinase [Microbispora sp. NBC_01189]
MKPLSPSDPTEIGGFVLSGVLGEGGMGKVYYGESESGELVAVKVIKDIWADRDDLRERFVREVEALKTALGPRVAGLVDADIEGKSVWLAVEYVPGETLEQHVSKRGPLSLENAAILGAALAEGLVTIHKAGLLHRDLKPHNILLGPSGPKVIDFGLAILHERKEALTAPGIPVGTLVCMSPEQARGEQPLPAGADIYGLGATLLYALTGHYPYDGATPYAIMYDLCNESVLPDLKGVPSLLEPLLGQMIAFNVGDRPGLPELKSCLVSLATREGITAAEARRRLIAATYVQMEPTATTPQPRPFEEKAGKSTTDPVVYRLPATEALATRLRSAYAKGLPL